ncbi:iron ABC transporter permease [Microbacterium sp. SORGH_AS_0888]|uniref:ABC transporter permease n=1 Tax=Microbacterium sp. SORGH_AS_0888 TaxID=3041791 RepID=UPI0027D7C3F3|nr:iron ABC transporter permease [Microbacterium sp. SORGH_AS_0888]
MAAVVGAAAAAPLVHLVLRVVAADPERLASVLIRPRTLELLATTVGVTTATSAGALVLGVGTAWLLTGIALPGAAFWRILACLPLAVPSFVAAFGWMGVFPGLSGAGPLVAVLVLSTAPYVTVPAMAAFARADRAVTDAAVSLGTPPLRAFCTTTLPQVLPAALAGTLLVALYSLSDFGAPALLRVDTLTTGIYAQFTGGFDRSLSAAMALVLAVLALGCVFVEGVLRRRSSARTDARAVPVAARRLGRGGSAGAMLLLAAVGVAAVVVPPTALIARLPATQRYVAEPVDLAVAAATTLAFGLVAAGIAVAAALPVAWLAARHRSRFVTALEAVTYVGHALPGLVVALALVSLTLAVAPGAYQGPLALIAAYVVLFLPKAVGSERAAFAGTPRGLEEAAGSLGDAPARVWRRITLPLAAPGILAGGVLVLAAVMKELPATLLLRPIGVDTLATELWRATSVGAYGAAALPALLLIAVGLIPALAVAHGIRSIGKDPR